MDKHEIRICLESEYDKLISFLKEHWKSDHIFVKSKEMLDFQHLDKATQQYNFIIALNPQTQEFDAVLGFIPLNFFDNNLTHNEFWLAIWKVKDSSKKSGIGLKVLLYFFNTFKPNFIAAIGISEDAKRIYKAFKYKLGNLEHFYIKNPLYKDFQIAHFENDKRAQNKLQTPYSFKAINPKDLTIKGVFHPLKSKDFLENRYAKHPFYTYKIYGIFEKELLKSAFVFRKLEVNGHCCLRIVDWLGDFIPNLYACFVSLLLEFEAEYIDFLCYVENQNALLNMGFTLKAKGEIIPNYFEPYLKENINLEFAYKSKVSPCVIFKGDSDQDRPNFIKE
ncbi:hypothetical protein [Helicobacter turcicus]|uniref:N-acetyltransferase domain-containing protein n=1 Tax=Helicobacter turcicus TaxID=2867412 RepID=A0ABS7JQ31_9HELI|nr:hypothetical protein [Helicobacter turcicus]MBX7491514.1 hypothetical protein [Helicobacter turcicus]MBX7546370.1 hypothetical protein [Helicobacter turcicus]